MSEIDKAIDSLVRFARSHEGKIEGWPRPGSLLDWPEVWFSIADYGNLAFRGEDAGAYRDNLTALARAYAKIHRDSSDLDEIVAALENPVHIFLLSALDPDNLHSDIPFTKRLDSARRALKDLLISRAVAWRVAVKVLGLVTDLKGIQVGNVRFIAEQSDEGRELVRSITQCLDDSDGVAVDDKRAVKAQILQEVEKSVLAFTDVTTEIQEVARTIALSRIRRAIDLLNFHAAFHPQSESAHAYLPGESSPGSPYLVLFAQLSGEPREGAGIFSGRYAGSNSVIQAHEFLGSPAGLSLAATNAILAKPIPSDLDQRLLVAMQWVGRALTPRRREEAFLFCAIALETLLLEEGAGPELTARLRQRAAHLLGRHKLSRVTIADNVNRLYEKRSKIVHRGRTDVAQEEFDLIQFYARAAIFRLLTDDEFERVASFDELVRWFEDRIYT